MPTPPISLTVEGETQLNLAVTRVSEALSDFGAPVGGKSLWDRLRVSYQESERELFETEGATGRMGTWAPLSAAYAKRKAVTFPGQGILRATGAMFDSLVGVTPDTVFRTTETAMEVGTKRLARYHWLAKTQRKAIDIGAEQEKTLFGRAMVEWGYELRKEFGAQ